jgi:uncharacterized protein YkwD
MATFEGARIGAFESAVREWRPGKFLPLYLAGIIAGLGLGIGIATWPSGQEAVPHQPAPMVAPLLNPVVSVQPMLPFEVTAPAAVESAGPELTLPGDFVPLPLEFQVAMGAIVPVVVPEPALDPVVEPIAPAAAQPAAPAKPVAPSTPAQQPAAQPQASAEPAAQAPAAKPNFYVPDVSTGPATNLESRLFALINEERVNAGLTPYVLDAGLTKIARTRSQQLVDQKYFAHKDPYGYSMYVELLAHFGYTSYAWAGENLAMNNYNVDESPGVALRGLMNSPTHKANLLANDFHRIGVGEVTDANGRHFFTMIFLG